MHVVSSNMCTSTQMVLHICARWRLVWRAEIFCSVILALALWGSIRFATSVFVVVGVVIQLLMGPGCVGSAGSIPSQVSGSVRRWLGSSSVPGSATPVLSCINRGLALGMLHEYGWGLMLVKFFSLLVILTVPPPSINYSSISLLWS
jgi:hypothetical protein